jgi:N utilization substance protein B
MTKGDFRQLTVLLFQYHFHGHDDFIKNEEDEKNLLTYQEVLIKLDQIDSLIDANLFNYTIDRLNLVDLAIIRISVFLMLTNTTEIGVIMNHALDITKELSELDDEKQHKFTNRLLDSIAKELKL